MIFCSCGSTLKRVEKMPAHSNVPISPLSTLCERSACIATPRPNFQPSSCSVVALSAPIWLVAVINSTVLRLSRRTPSSSPWFSSIWQNR